MDLGLTDRCLIVTGASRGLGFAAAKSLVDEGANVVLVARDQAVLDAAVEQLGPGRAVGIAADLAAETTSEIAAAAALARFGRLDGALISAGSPTPGTPMTASETAWREAFETVFLGGLRVARATASSTTVHTEPAGAGCSIVFVLSTSARAPIPGLALSNGLRPGLAMVVKDLADELGPQGVRVNGMLPGRIATDNVFAQDAREGNPDTVRRRREATIPLRRYGEPAEFGRVAAFLLSPAASYINGSLVTIDGGAVRSL
ncbi:MAG: SDR family oxidoreductase [Actinobacteria bacterium]|nr:SDR family oxidoreductase [Actinomycetota bacterium]MCB8996010.1 SDR family oxidoreductase [Actinomycetota bacterium]MCB9424099.1 SDR family oxidoreductase [Actinomycetota bacterium]